MFPSDLYGVLQQLQAQGIYAEPLLQNLTAKDDKKESRYFLIPISIIDGERLTIDSKTYRINELHATIYAVRGSKNSVYRPHLTGTYTDMDSGDEIKIRGFLNSDDSIDWIVYPKKSSNNNKRNKTPAQKDTPIEDNAAATVRSHMISHAAPILSLLRKKQTEFMQKNMQTYMHAEHYLKELIQDDASTPRDILSQVNTLIKLSEAIATVAPNYTYWAGICSFYRQLLVTYTEKNKQASLKKKTKKTATFFAQEPTVQPLLTVSSTETNAMHVNKQIISNLLAEVSAANLIAADILTDEQAKQQYESMQQLEAYLMSPNMPLSFTEQYNILDAVITTKKHLAAYCFSLLSKGETAPVEHYLKIISHLPERILRTCLDNDDATVYRFLLKNDLISIYQTIDGKKIYNLAFNENRRPFIDCFLDNGVHPWMMMTDMFHELFSEDGISTTYLKEKLTLLKNIYEQISTDYEKWSLFIDNFIVFLYTEQSAMTQRSQSFSALTAFISLLKISRIMSQLYSYDELERLNKPYLVNVWFLFEQLIGSIDESHDKIRVNHRHINALAAPFATILQQIADRMSRLTLAQKNSLKMQLTGDTQHPNDHDQQLREYFQLPIIASVINNRSFLRILGITDQDTFDFILKSVLTETITDFNAPNDDTYQAILHQYNNNKNIMIQRILTILTTPFDSASQTIWKQLMPSQYDWNQLITLITSNMNQLSNDFICYSDGNNTTGRRTWSVMTIQSMLPSFANNTTQRFFSSTTQPPRQTIDSQLSNHFSPNGS